MQLIWKGCFDALFQGVAPMFALLTILDLFPNGALDVVVKQNKPKLLEYSGIPLRQGEIKLYQKPNCKL